MLSVIAILAWLEWTEGHIHRLRSGWRDDRGDSGAGADGQENRRIVAVATIVAAVAARLKDKSAVNFFCKFDKVHHLQPAPGGLKFSFVPAAMWINVSVQSAYRLFSQCSV